jgi:hypothetical protein
MEKMQEIKFIAAKPHKVLSEKQAEAYLEDNWGMVAYIGKMANPTLEIFPTKDRKYAIETKNEAGEPKIIIKETFGEAIEIIRKTINDDQITVKIDKAIVYPADWAKKYNYKVGRD